MIARKREKQILESAFNSSNVINDSNLPSTVARRDATTGIIHNYQLSNLFINNVFFITSKDQLTTLNQAEQGDIAIFELDKTTYVLNGTYSNIEDWKTLSMKPTSAPPVGGSYIQFPGTPEPSVLWSGTTWEQAVQDGHFLRQAGGNAAEFEGTGDGTNDDMGGWQYDIFQDHKIQVKFTESGEGGIWTGPYGLAGIASNTNGTQINTKTEIIENQSGLPRTGSETRPINTTVKYWKRTA